MYVCMHVCVCIYLSIYLSVYVSICLSICLSVYVCMYVSFFLCMYVCMHVCMYVSLSLSIYIYIYIYMYISSAGARRGHPLLSLRRKEARPFVTRSEERVLAFTRYSFVDSGIAHKSLLILALNPSSIAPLCMLQSTLGNIRIPPEPTCFAIQHTILVLVLTIACKGQSAYRV